MEVVIVRMTDGPDVIGRVMNETDRGIHLDDVCLIQYTRSEQGYPSVFLTKYCMANLSFDAFFQRKDICQIFRDPVPTLMEQHERSINRLRKNYAKAFETVDEIEEQQFEISDYEKDYDDMADEIFLAMTELFSSNNSIH